MDTQPPYDLPASYEASRSCQLCTNEVAPSLEKPCKHVLCHRCDVGFKKQYPEHQCGLCQLQGRKGSSSDSGGQYARPAPQPRSPVIRRPSVNNESCESCGSLQQTVKYCTDCKMHICAACVRQHSTMAVLKSHHLVSPSPMMPKPPPHHRVPEETTSPPLNTVNSPTFDELSREVSSLLTAVNRKSDDLIKKIDKADQDVQAHTKISVQDFVKRAEQMKKEIDEDLRRQTELLSSEQRHLLSRFRSWKRFIVQQSETITSELTRANEEAKASIRRVNRQSQDDEGYTQMAAAHELTVARRNLRKKIEGIDKLIRELIFPYDPNSNPGEGLGKLKSMRKIYSVAETRVVRFETEDSYVATAMASAPGTCILFTSCKGADKAAADLVNSNGNPLHTRKLQDKGQNPSQTPAYSALIDNGVVVMGWETSLFSMKIAARDEVSSFSVREFLVSGANICCLTVDHQDKRIAFGNDKNKIINMVNYEMKHVATVNIKEECRPPISLAFWGKNILITDGTESAFATDPRGNTIARFLPPQAEDLGPIAVDTCGETAYVLWATEPGPSTNAAAYVQCYSLATDSTGEQVSSALTVPKDTKFIAVISSPDEDDRLVTGTEMGDISIYCVQEM